MNLPIAIIDARSPKQALQNLSKKFEVIPFQTQGITIESISGHPDIFIFQDNTNLIFAPNIPNEILQKTDKNKYHIGNTYISNKNDEMTKYNCIATNQYFIHKENSSDKKIIEKQKNKIFIQTKQAFTRCTTFPINDNTFITSDLYTQKQLLAHNCSVLFVSPEDIQLPPYKYGFIGGCLGKYKDTIYINGNLSLHKQGNEIKSFIESKHLSICELHDGQMYDGGGIFFIND